MLDAAGDGPTVPGNHLVDLAGNRHDQVSGQQVTRLLLGMLVGRNHRARCQLEFNQLRAAAIEEGLALDAGEGTDITFRAGVIDPGLNGR